MKICPVILCGGAGTRLWPLSRRKYPKQFMDLGGHTLFGDTLQRLAALPGLAAPVVICNEEQRFLAAAALQRQGLEGRILLEPEPRNTAPAIAAAALAVTAACDVEDGDPVLLVLPSDHVLEDLPAFAAAVSRAVDCAREGALVTFGVTPDRPETGYGYIEKGDALASGFAVRRFVEKPAREAAEAMLAQGGYFWNSGMFVFRASQYLAELEVQAPAIMAAVRKAWALRRTDYDFIRLHGESFARCPSDSVDYALMEKSARVAMVPLPCRWSDLGSWEAVYENSARDAEGNACVGDVLAQDSRGCYIHAASRLVTTLGVEDLVVVETGDAVLVADRARSQRSRPWWPVLPPRGATSRISICASTGPGAGMRPWPWASVSRSSASRSIPVPRFPCNGTGSGPSTGSSLPGKAWCAWGTKRCTCMWTSLSTSPRRPCTG